MSRRSQRAADTRRSDEGAAAVTSLRCNEQEQSPLEWKHLASLDPAEKEIMRRKALLHALLQRTNSQAEAENHAVGELRE